MKYFITYVDDIRKQLLKKKWKTDKKFDPDLVWMLYKDVDFLKYDDQTILNHFKNSYLFCIKSNLVKLSKINHKINEFSPKSYLQDELRKKDIDESKTYIVKPSTGSCGKNIQFFNDVAKMFLYLKKNEKNIIQEYIENPLLISNKKFDIRQWVLITSIDPLEIHLGEFYLRFSKYDYNIQKTNKFIHLTNYAVQKKSVKKTNIKNNMWDSDSFKKYLFEKKIPFHYIEKQIKNIIIETIKEFSKYIVHRKNSFELLGYDLMIDENLKVWLIEINVSPDLSHSTPITEKIVKNSLQDILNFKIDNQNLSFFKKIY
jgi:tubulin monoglycylase TTLL3/8